VISAGNAKIHNEIKVIFNSQILPQQPVMHTTSAIMEMKEISGFD
jgi:hypothetical protein